MKNKDALVSYIIGFNHSMTSIVKQLPEDFKAKLVLEIHSMRFNDILPSGENLHRMTEEEYKKIQNENKELETEYHPDNNVNKPFHFLSINCPNCSNPYVFKTPMEIPNENFRCGLCDRVLIDYTGHDDWEYQYTDSI